MKLDAAELLVAISYATDATPNGCVYHSWRVALVAEYLSRNIAPELGRDLFYGGLLHDIGAVGAYKHITEYNSLQEELSDAHIVGHPRRGAVLAESVPGFSEIALNIRYHHEWIDGTGYPDRRSDEDIPLGSQILALADTLDMNKCFNSKVDIGQALKQVSAVAGKAFPVEVWNEFVRAIADKDFITRIRKANELPNLMKETLAKHPLPDKLLRTANNGVDKILRLGANLVDLKDPTTRGHSERVARLASVIAQNMSLEEEDVKTAFQAGMVHDIGRLGVPTMILTKSGRPNQIERSIIQTHPDMTARSIECLPDTPEMDDLAYIASHDHEQFDGRGYPDGLAREDIPIISRIISVADAYDAVVFTKNYRLLSPRKAIVQLKEASGTQFDPKPLNSLLDIVNRNALPDVSDIAA